MPTVTTPSQLSRHERELLHEQVRGQSPRLVLRTDTKVDTGRWWRRTRLYLCVLDDELLLFAASRRRYTQRVPLSACRPCRYCHTAGALSLGAGDDLRFRHLAMPPSEALRVLALIEASGDEPPTTPSTPTENERA